MSFRQPIVLVIASVLKPVDDVRMYKKFAKSLDRTGKYVVNIVGYQTQRALTDPTVHFHPVFNFTRLHWRRLLANYHFYQALKKLSPGILILTTPELYPAVWWYRQNHNVKLVYDMVENYGRNIQYNQGFVALAVGPLSQILALIERRLSRESTLLLSAEQGYLKELHLDPASVTVVENKALEPASSPKKNANLPSLLSVIYTGTVSEVYGINQALAVMKALVEQEKLPIKFTILGHVPKDSLHDQLRAYAQLHAWVVLQTQDRPVPHEAILALIQEADFGMVSHQPVPSIAQCFPTRIWEYMAYRLPFLLQDHPYWTDYCQPWDCAIPIDFNQPQASSIRQKMLTQAFYSKGVPESIFWKTEEIKLIKALDNLTTNR